MIVIRYSGHTSNSLKYSTTMFKFKSVACLLILKLHVKFVEIKELVSFCDDEHIFGVLL